MANVHKFTENIRSQFGGHSSALGGETSDVLMTPEFVDMANYDLVAFQCGASGVASDSVITLLAYEGTTSAGAGSASLTHTLATDTFTSTNTTDTDVLVVQVRGEDLSSGFQFVGARASTGNASGTEKVAIVINQLRGRYKQATLPA